MERLWSTLRLAAVAAGCLFSIATSAPEGGDRARGDDDDDDWSPDAGPAPCPADETCSPETPNGLYFGAPAFSDDPWFDVIPPPPTAVGGRQTIMVYRDAEATVPLWLAYDAVTTDPSIIEVVEAAAPTVSARAHRAGTTTLRLVEAGTDLLLDRISIASAVPVGVELRLAREDQPYWTEGELPLLAVGTRASLVVALYSANGVRLADNDLRVTRPASWPDDPTRWDVFEAVPDAPATYVLSVDSGGQRFSVSVEAVDRIDEIVYDGYTTEVPVSSVPATRFCFRAVTGDRRVHASWQFTARGDLSIAQDDFRECVRARGVRPGSGTLTASALGRELSLELATVASAMPAPAPAPGDETSPALIAGERAGASAAR